jgi:GPH family glycoside/pentoside/hexuronide:cation symporter
MAVEPADTLTTRERLAYSAFNGADLLIKNIIGKYMFFFYTTSLGVPPLWIAIGQPLVKLLDVVTDPMVGEWSDRTRHPMGRRRPWILCGSVVLGIVFPLTWAPTFVMFWDPAPTLVAIFAYFLIFKLLYYISHTMVVVPYYALGAELSTDYQERTKIVAWRHLVGVPVVILATVPFVLATNPELFPNETTGIAVVMLGVGVIIIATGLVTSFGTRERTPAERKPPLPLKQALKITLRNRPFMFLVATVLIYGIGQYFAVSFAVYLVTFVIYDGDKAAFATLLLEATVVAVVVSIGLNFLIRRIGRHVEKVRLVNVCLALSLTVPFAVLVSFEPEQPYWYLVFHALALPIGNTMIEILPLSIVADVCDIDEVESGRRREGAFVGVYNSAFKTGYLLAPSMTMFLLSLTGFDGLAPQQSVETQELMRFYLLTGTAATFSLAFVMSLGIRLKKSAVDAAQAKLQTSALRDSATA